VEDYKVKLEVFEGPLDLLLYLIKRDEVDIYDISIERITKQYLSYLDAFQVLNIELAGEFIVMAANLLYIKSRTLLPVEQQMAEEDAEEDDPRWELIRQLIEYKKFKEAASLMRDQEAMQENLFARVPVTPDLAPSENLLVDEVGILTSSTLFKKSSNGWRKSRRTSARFLPKISRSPTRSTTFCVSPQAEFQSASKNFLLMPPDAPKSWSPF